MCGIFGYWERGRRALAGVDGSANRTRELRTLAALTLWTENF